MLRRTLAFVVASTAARFAPDGHVALARDLRFDRTK